MVYHIKYPLSQVPPGLGIMSLGIFLADGCVRLDSPSVAGVSGVRSGLGGSPLDVSWELPLLSSGVNLSVFITFVFFFFCSL